MEKATTITNYNIRQPWNSLDPWQKEVIESEGNIVVRSGRQAGKSTAIAIKAGNYALTHKKASIMVISSVERQAYLLFEKILEYITSKSIHSIRKGNKRPTKNKLQLNNGSIILCLPTGLSGRGIRGFTIDILIADEAAFIPEEVWAAVTPMIAVTGGSLILLSTPFGREGYFYRCFKDDSFKKFHVSTPDCPRMQTDEGKVFLKQEESRMTKLQWGQEYLGEFVDELRQFFPDELIRRCMKLERPETVKPNRDYYIGVDIARMGKDESTFEVLDGSSKTKLKQVENIITRKTLLNQTIDQILALNRSYCFKKIYVDDGGMGVGVFDFLLVNPSTKRTVVAINNARRCLNKDETRYKKLLKEDLYNNLLRLMERGEIELLNDDTIFFSLKSVQYEYTKVEGKATSFRIFGNNTHIAEGLIRSAWCVQDKSLNIWCR